MKSWRERLLSPWVAAGAFLTAAGVAFIRIGAQVLWILFGIALGLIVVWFIRRLRQGREAGRFRAGLSQNASKAPASIDDPAKRAEFDRLRDKFNQGLQRVLDEGRRKGVDYLYRHPWILIVGEPGSGKTEAIRHSGIVSARMQDELQGAGGTLNMDWWFTDRAVILDTAGRMVFEEESTTANNEFHEFLRLLRKGRPLTPINGLLVTVSADTLVTGTDDEIHERSTKLGQKIAEIQAALEVRFPVYVLVTKCDKITGFHEFFQTLAHDDPAAQQILGWSNPEGLDSPFRPEDIEQHLNDAIKTLSEVRYRLLDRTTEPAGGGRRIDEVDSLFAFPQSLRMIASRLKLYLEPVFATGEWSSSSPPFVRGVYFSSAISTGAVLDKELATALGVPLETLGYEGGVFERKWALFLRDLFVDKILPERGLVTSNPRIEGIVWRRRLITWSALGAVLVIGLGLIFWADHTFRSGLERELAMWRTKFTKSSKPEHRQVIAVPLFIQPVGKDGDIYIGEDKTVSVGAEFVSPAEYQRNLEERTRKPLHLPWIFRPVAAFGSDFDRLRRQAQHAVFLADVARPLVDTARARIKLDPEWTPDHTRILSTLVEFENAQPGVSFVGSPEAVARMFWQFGLRTPNPNEPLEGLFRRSYESVAGAAPVWPSPQFATGDNGTISAGIEKLAGSVAQMSAKTAESIDLLRKLRTSLGKLAEIEDQLGTMARGGSAASDALKRYVSQADEIEGLMRQCTAAGVFAGAVTLMDDAIASMRTNLDRAFEQSLKQFRDNGNGPLAAGDRRSSALAEIADRFAQHRDAGLKRIDEAFPAASRAKIRELDERFLLRDPHGLPLYGARLRLLKNVESAPTRAENGIETRLIGHLAEFDRMIVGASADKKTPVAESGDTKKTVGIPDVFTSGVRDILVHLYEGEFDQFLDDHVAFPLVKDRRNKQVRLDDLPKIRSYLRALEQDAPAFDPMIQVNRTSRASAVKRRVTECRAQLEQILNSLLEPGGELASVKVTYPAALEQEDTVKKIVGSNNLRLQGANQLWRDVGSDLRETPWRSDEEHEIGKFRVSSGDLRLYFYLPDSSSPDGEALRPLENWELFTRILEPGREPNRRDDGLLWRVAYSRKDGKTTERFFALSFLFSRPLPAPDRWPTFSQLRKN